MAGIGNLEAVLGSDDVVTGLYFRYLADENSMELLSEIGSLSDKTLRSMGYSTSGMGIAEGILYKDLTIMAEVVDSEGSVIGKVTIGESYSDYIFKEVNIHGKINTEIDEVDLVNQIIYENKSASKLYMENPDFFQTEQQWAYKQIYKKGCNRIEALNQSKYTLSIVGSENVPEIKSLKSIRKFVFRIDADTPELRQAVEQCLNMLRAKYPEYSFSAIYGGK